MGLEVQFSGESLCSMCEALDSIPGTIRKGGVGRNGDFFFAKRKRTRSWTGEECDECDLIFTDF